MKTKHPIKEAERPFPCDECGKTYKSKNSLREHVKIVHMKSAVRQAITIHCPTCGKVFHQKGHYYTHDYIQHKGMRAKCKKCKIDFRPACNSYDLAKEKFKAFKDKHSFC